MREIITYNDITNLHNNSFYNEFSNYPHITVSHDMKKQMKDMYGSESKLKINKINNIFSIKELQEKIIGNWDYTKLQQILSLSSIIRQLKLNNDKKNFLFYQSLTKNKIELLNSIRLLVEANVYPNDIDPENIEEQYLKIVWEKYEQEEPSLREFRFNMDRCLNNKDYIQKILHEFKIDKQIKIVLHGFYFVTPIQERIFKILENCGKKLVFLCNIHTPDSEIDKIWYLNFENIFYKDDKLLWKKDKDNFNSSCFQNIFDGFENKIDKNTVKNIKIIKYSSQMDFIRDIQRLKNKNDYRLYTTDIKSTENILRDYYPELFKERNYLSYPIGQYIYILHSIWNEQTKCINISTNDLRICFASGLVSKDGKNGLDYLDDLELISTFVGNCKTINDWKKRLNLLKEIKIKIINEFDKEDFSLDYKNPFRYFSCFGVDEQRLSDIILLINEILDTASFLFNDNSEINIKEYLNKLRNILSKKEFILKDFISEEQEIFRGIWNELELNNTTLEKCMPNEMCEAIKFALSGKRLSFWDNEDNEEDGKFKTIYELDSSPLACNNKIVHLCFADDSLMPGKISKYMWPLTSNLLKRIEKKCIKEKRYFISAIRLIIENNLLVKRYLFNCLMKNKNIEISYISELGDEKRNISPYVALIKDLYNLKYVNINELQKIKRNNELDELDCIETLNEKFITANDIKINDRRLCFWKYIYNYKLNKYQIYIDRFHYSFAIPRLISLIKKRTELDLDLIKEETLDLFPYFYCIQKNQLKDYVSIINHNEVDNDFNYYNIHYLNQDVINIINNASYKINEKDDVKYYICMYCSYSNTCPHRNRLLRRPSDLND